jgi:poly(3-hydroxybutyrate) depolymerase
MRLVLRRASVAALLCAAAGCGSANVPAGGQAAGPDSGATPAPTSDASADAGAGAGADAGAYAETGSDAPSPDATSSPDDAAAALAGLHIDLSQTSVSGISSGAFMAVQFGVAFSSIVKGIGVFAGGPFDCSEGTLSNAENQCGDATSAPDVTSMIAATKSLSTSGAIDDVSNLATMRVFLFSGADDAVVSPPVVDAAQTYFQAFLPAASIQYVSRRAGTAHTMPTLNYGGNCDQTAAPWIGDCNYDGAGAALAQIYGTLTAAASAASGTVTTLAQADFVADPASHSLDSNAYVYVPASCAAGETCRVHVAFHGCEMQASGVIGSAYYLHAGYNEWADTNHIVVLYPQLITTSANPYACWDFWGYDSAQFDTKSAPQMAVTRAMVGFLAGAAGDE